MRLFLLECRCAFADAGGAGIAMFFNSTVLMKGSRMEHNAAPAGFAGEPMLLVSTKAACSMLLRVHGLLFMT